MQFKLLGLGIKYLIIIAPRNPLRYFYI